MTGGRSFDDPSRQAPPPRERKDVVASAAGEQRYGAPIGTEIGQARDDNERAAQGNARARKLMEDVDPSVGGKELAARFSQLDDADLQGLTKLAYSFRGTSPEIVAVRTALANALAARGQDVRQFGARGGGKGPDRPGKGKGDGKGKGGKASKLKGDDNGDGRIDEDESGWDPGSMGNRRGYRADGTYVDNSRRKPEVVRKVRGEKGLTMGDGMSLFGDVETKAQSARTRTDGKPSNDPSSTSTFPSGDWHPAPKGMTCSRHQHGDNPPPAVAYRVVNGTKLGACKTHKAEMTESKGLVDPREDLIFETKSDGHVPPQSVRANGRKAQEAIKAGKAGANFTSAGRTRAAQLARGDALSLATVKRMHSYFERHSGGDQGKQHQEGTPAHTAWLAWGGSAGRNWARGIVNARSESKTLVRVAPGEPLGAGLDDAEAWDEGVTLALLSEAQFKLAGFKPGQSQPSKNPGATKLREYWVHGKGAVKIKWGVPGDFKRCVRQMRKYVGTRAEGLCNVYHRAALGVAPGQEGGGKGHGHKGVLLDSGDQVEFKTLYVESDGGDYEMRLVRMIDAPEVKGGHWLDPDEDEDAAEALDELDDLDHAERKALETAVEALDDDRRGLVEALTRRERKSHYNDPDALYHGYGDPGVAPWQRHVRATGDAYGAGMMLGLAGLRADAPVVREAKAAGVPLVDVVDVFERKDVSTASGGTTQSWSFGSAERESGADEVAAANARATGPRRLRHHFTRSPEGLQEWRPSQPGRFRRLTKALRKHVGAGAEGVAAIYYRQVMGHWPGTAGRGNALSGVKSLGVHWDALARPDLYGIEAKGTPPPPPRKSKGKRVPPPKPDTEELTPEEVAAAQAEDDDPVEPLPDDPSQTPEDGTERAEDEQGAAPAKMANRVPELDADADPEPDEDEDAETPDPNAEDDTEQDADPGQPVPVAPNDGAPRGEGDEGEVAEPTDPADPDASDAAMEPEIDPETGEPVEGDQPSLDAAVAGEDGSVSPALAALFPELSENGGPESGEGEFEDALMDDPDYLINPDGSLQMVDDDGNPVDEESADDELGRPDLDAGPGDQAAGDPSDPDAEDDGEEFEEEDPDAEDAEDDEEFEEEDPDVEDIEDDEDDVEQDDDEGDEEQPDIPGDADHAANPPFGRPPTPNAGPKAGPTGPRPPVPPKGPPSQAKPTRQAARGEDPGPGSTGPVDGTKPGPVDKPGKAAKPGKRVNQPPFGQGRPPRRKSGPSRATKAILS